MIVTNAIVMNLVYRRYYKRDETHEDDNGNVKISDKFRRSKDKELSRISKLIVGLFMFTLATRICLCLYELIVVAA